jgi:hypothetical protein
MRFNKYNVVPNTSVSSALVLHSNFGIFHIVISILVNVILDLFCLFNFSKRKKPAK